MPNMIADLYSVNPTLPSEGGTPPSEVITEVMTHVSEDLFSGIPLFERLSSEERYVLAELSELVAFPRGTILFQRGDPGEALYIVRSGSVALWMKDFTGELIELETCGPGHLFGELALFDGGARTATAEALEHTETIMLGRDQFLEFLQNRPGIAIEVLAGLASRLRRANEIERTRTSRNVNAEIRLQLGIIDRIADGIATFAGSMPFLYLHIALFAGWIVVNLDLIPGVVVFDPFPFGLLTMSVSLEAIFLSMFVLLSQNLQRAKEWVRADIEYNVNLKAEREVAHLHEKIDHLHQETLARLQRVEHAVSRSWTKW